MSKRKDGQARGQYTLAFKLEGVRLVVAYDAQQIALQRLHAVCAKVPVVNGGGHVTRPQGEDINQMLGLKQVVLYGLQADGYCTRFNFFGCGGRGSRVLRY